MDIGDHYQHGENLIYVQGDHWRNITINIVIRQNNFAEDFIEGGGCYINVVHPYLEEPLFTAIRMSPPKSVATTLCITCMDSGQRTSSLIHFFDEHNNNIVMRKFHVHTNNMLPQYVIWVWRWTIFLKLQLYHGLVNLSAIVCSYTILPPVLIEIPPLL